MASMNEIENKKQELSSEELLHLCQEALEEKKADELNVIDLRGKSNIADYFILATAHSEAQLRALQNNLRLTLKDAGQGTFVADYRPESGWFAMDLGSIIVHVFLPEQRQNYRLDSLLK